MIGSTDELPPALDGVVPLDDYREILSSVADRAADYRGGPVQILVAMFQACLFLVIMLGFLFSKYMNRSFFNPITILVLGTLELGVLAQSARFLKREETRLIMELLKLLHPWRQEYGIIAKVRKTKGQITEGKKSSTHYCLVLEKMGPDRDIDTASVSTFTQMESDIESQV